MKRRSIGQETETVTVRIPKIVVEAWKATGLTFPEFALAAFCGNLDAHDANRSALDILKAEKERRIKILGAEVSYFNTRIATLENTIQSEQSTAENDVERIKQEILDSRRKVHEVPS